MGTDVIPVGIVEDHPFFRAGLCQALAGAPDMDLLACVGSVEELDVATLPHIAVVLLDLHLPGLKGPAAVRRVREQGPAVLVLSASEGRDAVVEAVKAGAAGYLSKQVEEPELLKAVRTVAAGRTYVSPTLASYLLEASVTLTSREREILELVAAGDTDQDIADLLVISVHTVHSHLDRIRQKTGRHRRGELAALASNLDDGLV